jgi:hypothetical protein
MRVLPDNRKAWMGMLLLPFTAYLPLGILSLIVWSAATGGHSVRGGFAEAAARVCCGYILCVFVFVLTAGIRFATHRRELVAEALILAGIAFIIALLLTPFCATS